MYGTCSACEGESELILLSNNKWKGLCHAGNLVEAEGPCKAQWRVYSRLIGYPRLCYSVKFFKKKKNSQITF